MPKEIGFRNGEIFHQRGDFGRGAGTLLETPHVTARIGIARPVDGALQCLCNPIVKPVFEIQAKSLGDMLAESIDFRRPDRQDS